jgi:hypothetical protein
LVPRWQRQLAHRRNQRDLLAGNLSSTFASNKVYLNYLGETRNISASQGFNGDDVGDTTCLNARWVGGSYACGYIDHIGRVDYPGGVFFNETFRDVLE